MAGLLMLFLRSKAAKDSNVRYAVALAALTAILICGLFTWAVLEYEPAVTAEAPSSAFPNGQVVSITERVPTERLNLVGAETVESDDPLGGSARSNWRAWAICVWLIGVAVMLSRAVCTAVGGARLRRRCTLLEDEHILALVEQLRRSVGIARRIRVALSRHICVPGVVGFVWPTLLLPASMLSGIPADGLRAVLAHELAHINRYDYLVNFCQMLIEAIFFFNPAVWWIGRQIRFEREACCDKAGVAATGQKMRYAEALADWAQRLKDANVSVTAPVIRFGRADDSGGMLERVRRIVVAGHRPRLRVSWYVAAITLILSVAILVGLWRGTTMTVALAGKLLTPQQRIDKIAEISKEYGFEDREYGLEDEIQISGVVRTYDGRPLPEDTQITLRSHRPSHGVSMGISMSESGHFTKDGSLNTQIEFGRVTAMARCSTYAPAFAGPFEAEPGGSIVGIELVLGKGFQGHIKVVDEADQPIPGAKIIGGYMYPEGGYHHTIHLTTDSNGVATIQHAIARELGLQIEADGFGSERFEGPVPDPNKAVTLSLKSTPATTGTVISKETGEPIEGAEVWVMMSRRGHHSYGENGRRGEPEAVTDETGRFKLTKLRPDREYLVLVKAENYGPEYLSNFKAGDSDLVAALGPTKTIRGRIVGDLNRLNKNRTGIPEVTYWQRYGFEYTSHGESQKYAEITIKDDIGYFEIEDCWGQRVNIWAGGERVSVKVDEDPLDKVVIELKPLDEEMRKIVLRFQVPEGSPPVQGGVRIDYCRPGDAGMKPGWLDIEDGRAQCEIPTPGQFKYSVSYHEGKRPVGYWFKEIKAMDIPAGHDPFIIDVPVHPAGAVYGQVLRADGSPAEKVSMSLIVARKPEIMGAIHNLHGAPQSKGLDRSKFNASPLPLDGEYTIVASEGNYLSVTEPILLNEANPIRERNIRFGKGITLSGRLIDIDGGPAVNTVSLEVSLKCGSTSLGTECSKTKPDLKGRFSFDNVNPDFTGEYFIEAIVAPGYRPVRKEVEDIDKPVIIQLERGLRARGRIIDETTGWPVPGVKVAAYFV
ncbi:MAG: carboxypeptidase regulatory-like domain-containing protein, partial [Phycisphaerales bacterium]